MIKMTAFIFFIIAFSVFGEQSNNPNICEVKKNFKNDWLDSAIKIHCEYDGKVNNREYKILKNIKNKNWDKLNFDEISESDFLELDKINSFAIKKNINGKFNYIDMIFSNYDDISQSNQLLKMFFRLKNCFDGSHALGFSFLIFKHLKLDPSKFIKFLQTNDFSYSQKYCKGPNLVSDKSKGEMVVHYLKHLYPKKEMFNEDMKNIFKKLKKINNSKKDKMISIILWY